MIVKNEFKKKNKIENAPIEKNVLRKKKDVQRNEFQIFKESKKT
jgi:hypothetical protein